jgi:predicted SAM-dependent methyltransferase
MKLNLGCGLYKLDGFRNVDKFAACDPNEVVDLEVFPWPWADDSVDEVVMSHVLMIFSTTQPTFAP